MENFEYSIQLNDRAWAEFCSASEECHLLQPALAATEEQLLSDLEEGEAGESRLIRVRVSPALAHHHATSRLPPEDPHGHLFAEEVFSGSEDETDLGSVSRFLCNNSPLGRALPSGIPAIQLPHDTLKPSGPARERGAAFAAKERESEARKQPRSSDASLSVVATAVHEVGLQRRSPGQETSARLVSAVHRNRGDVSAEGMDKPVEENLSGPLCLELPHTKGDASQTASADVLFPEPTESVAVHDGNPEPLESRAVAVCPSAAHSSPPDSTEPEGAERPKKGCKRLQVILTARAMPCQEEPLLFQRHSFPLVGALTTESHGGRVEGWGRTQREQGAAGMKDEGRVDPSEDFSQDSSEEEGRLDPVTASSAGNGVNLQQSSGEEKKRPKPTLVADSRCDATLDRRGATGRAEKAHSEEVGCRLGMAVPSEEGSPSLLCGRRISDFLDDPVPCHQALEGSPEGNLTAMTWPEMYDYFFCDDDDTQEQERRMPEGTGEERLGSSPDPELPEMYGPEMYEYFFYEMGESGARAGSRGKEAEVEVTSSCGLPLASEDPDADTMDSAMHISIPEVYEHFFANGAKDKRNWRRRLLSTPACEARKAARALKAFICKPAGLLQSRPRSHRPLLERGSQGTLVLLPPRPLPGSQPRAEGAGMAVMLPERPLQPVLTQRDMCLGFVAFASWAVKTSDLQAPDAWKIVVLASFGTLSAIRYFRRQVIVEGRQGT